MFRFKFYKNMPQFFFLFFSTQAVQYNFFMFASLFLLKVT